MRNYAERTKIPEDKHSIYEHFSPVKLNRDNALCGKSILENVKGLGKRILNRTPGAIIITGC